MKTIVAIGALLVSLVGLLPMPAQAGAATDAALGLRAFAVFNQIIGGIEIFGPRWAYPAPVHYPSAYAYPYYYPPAPVYAGPAVTYYAAPTPAPAQTEVVHPHGRYVLRGDGVMVAYQWVWVPNPPSRPPPPAPPSARR